MVQGIEHRAEPLHSPKRFPKRNGAPKWSPACPRGYCLRGNLCITPAWSPRHQTCPWGLRGWNCTGAGMGLGGQQRGGWYKKQALENTSDTPAVTLLPDASHMWPSLQKGSESPKTQPPERCPWGFSRLPFPPRGFPPAPEVTAAEPTPPRPSTHTPHSCSMLIFP